MLEDGERAPVPYRAICTDRAVLGIMASNFGASIGFQIFFQYGPVYLNQVGASSGQHRLGPRRCKAST